MEKLAPLGWLISLTILGHFIPNCQHNWISPGEKKMSIISVLQQRALCFHDLFCCFPVTQSCLTLCEPTDGSTPGFPVLHYLLKFFQTHVHWVDDATQSSHSLSPSSPPALNLSQHQELFQWVGSLHQVAKVLKLQLQRHSFQWILRVDFLSGWLVWSPCYPRDSQESSPIPQFDSINSLVLSLLYGPISLSIYDYWKNCGFDYVDLCWQSDVIVF